MTEQRRCTCPTCGSDDRRFVRYEAALRSGDDDPGTTPACPDPFHDQANESGQAEGRIAELRRSLQIIKQRGQCRTGSEPGVVCMHGGSGCPVDHAAYTLDDAINQAVFALSTEGSEDG